MKKHSQSWYHLLKELQLASIGRQDIRKALDSAYRKSIREFNDRVDENRHILRSLKFCKCPTPECPVPTSSTTCRSPVDQLGFRFKCCWCIPLKPATVIIGIILLMFAFVQLTTVDKTMGNIFPKKEGDVFYYSKLVYLCLATGFLFACGILLLGVSLSNYKLVHIFIWYAFLYNIIHAVMTATAFAMHTMRTGNATGKHVLRFAMGMAWNCLVFYFLMIVNSYKMLIWPL